MILRSAAGGQFLILARGLLEIGRSMWLRLFRLIKEGTIATADQLRIPQALHRFALRESLSILMYHAVVRAHLPVTDWCFVDEGSFRRQMLYLMRQFHVVPLEQAVTLLKRRQIVRPTAVITFDDGFQNVFETAFPILHELRLPCTIFLTTSLLGTKDTIWFARLHDAVSSAAKSTLSLQGRTLDLSSPFARSRASATVQTFLKELPVQELRSTMQVIMKELEYDIEKPLPEGSPYRILDALSIRTMVDSGLVEFGGHTANHSILSKLAPQDAELEIHHCLAHVSRLTGKPCRLFAYPNGRAVDYNENIVRMLERHGVVAAVTTIMGPNLTETPRLELRRYGVGAFFSDARYRALIHHFLWYLSRKGTS